MCLLLLTIQSRLMLLHPHSLLRVPHTPLLVLLMVLVSHQLVPAIAQRALATARPVPHTVQRVHRIPPLRQHLVKLLVSRPPVQFTARQVHHIRLRVLITTLRPLVSNRVLRARSTALLVRWVTRLRVLSLPLDRIQDPLARLQAHQSGHPL